MRSVRTSGALCTSVTALAAADSALATALSAAVGSNIGADATWAICAEGAAGAGRGAAGRLLPISRDNAGVWPLPRSPISSSRRPMYFSLTQSSTKRLGAYTRNSSPCVSTCSGRIQVLNCWEGSSSRRTSTHCCHSSTDTRFPSLGKRLDRQGKGRIVAMCRKVIHMLAAIRLPQSGFPAAIFHACCTPCG
ncbi:hypothetical protein D3C86_1666490 [compost metagenome]